MNTKYKLLDFSIAVLIFTCIVLGVGVLWLGILSLNAILGPAGTALFGAVVVGVYLVIIIYRILQQQRRKRNNII